MLPPILALLLRSLEFFVVGQGQADAFAWFFGGRWVVDELLGAQAVDNHQLMYKYNKSLTHSSTLHKASRTGADGGKGWVHLSIIRQMCQIIIYQFMRILWLSFLLLILAQLAHPQQDPTTLIFYYEHEDEQAEDYIQVEVLVEAEGTSLTSTINSATATAAEIKTIAMDYCRGNKGKGDCKEAAEVSHFQIQPKYQKIRREDTFESFIVSHQITINVYSPARIGALIDSLLKVSGLTLKGFEWVPFEEVEPEQAAIKGGLEEAEGLCEQLGLQLGRVVNVEQIIQEAEQVKEASEEDQEQQQQQPQTVVYKLEVECLRAKK